MKKMNYRIVSEVIALCFFAFSVIQLSVQEIGKIFGI